MDLSSGQGQAHGSGSRSAGHTARHRHGYSVPQAELKSWWPELNAAPKPMGPGPCFSQLFSQQSEAPCQCWPWAQAAKFWGGRVALGALTQIHWQNDALCIHHLVVNDFLRTLYACYPSPWRNALQNRKLVEHLPTCTQNSKNSVHALQVIAVFWLFFFIFHFPVNILFK